MSTDEYVKVPRLTIEVSEDLATRFSDAIPWGLRSKVMALIIEDLLDMIEKEGNLVIVALLNRVIKAEHVIKDIPKEGRG